jgi:hypothetical protein
VGVQSRGKAAKSFLMHGDFVRVRLFIHVEAANEEQVSGDGQEGNQLPAARDAW